MVRCVLWFLVLMRIGFLWDPGVPGLPDLINLGGSVQHCRSATLDAWNGRVSADLCAKSGFRGGPLLDILVSHQLLTSSHVWERDKALLRSVMVGDRCVVSLSLAGSLVVLMGMVIFFLGLSLPSSR